MYLIVAGIVVAVAAVLLSVLLVLGYRVLKNAHSRPPRPGIPHSHDGQAAASQGHTGLERLVLGILTRLIRLTLRSGFRMGPMMMLTVRGRTSGIERTNPVDVFERDGRRWLVATHDASANWVRNLRAAGAGSLARGRRHYPFTAAELPQDQAGVILRDILGPRLAKPVGGFVLRQTLGVAPGAEAADFFRAAADHPVFEITVTAGAERQPSPSPPHPGAGVSVRSAKTPAILIVVGLLVVAAHAALGVAHVMTAPQWISGVAIGLLIAGVANHFRIFGRQR